jgi:hypothetical protein
MCAIVIKLFRDVINAYYHRSECVLGASCPLVIKPLSMLLMPGITGQCVPQGQICTPRGQRALAIKLFWDVIGAKYYRPVYALGASVCSSYKTF